MTGVEALAKYADGDTAQVTRYTVECGLIATDGLGAEELRRWVDGHDPHTDAPRGRELRSPRADLILDGTINAPKTYSIAALINDDLAAEFEALQDRLRNRIITTWQRELNARRGAGGSIREGLHRIEVVELQHRRSRALDPHIHRHLWLNVKVLGEDGKWSNVDSRVAMRLHTLINAEGELAARSDPSWVQALARNGYTLDSDGEIGELASAVRPMSRRSNQIEANRAKLLLVWRSGHPGQEPDHDVLQHIDRLAWAKNRPNKPGVVDEKEWEELIRDELREIDPSLLARRPLARVRATAIGSVDRDILAARAIVDADSRSTGCGGRFSSFDLRAGVTRAVAGTGIVADRENLQELIEDVVARSLAHTVDLLDQEGDRPGHIKGYMASATAGLKLELAQRFDLLTYAGEAIGHEVIVEVSRETLPRDVVLDPGQANAAASIAGTDRLVSVIGPAGAGKTTMLRVVRSALENQGRQLVVVAPTKKAASVAAREIGATALSLHALLADHGWRWGRDEAGGEVWTRLRVGERDRRTGVVFEGPRRFVLRPGDRVVVDEAGMVDLHTARALAAVAAETGAGIAMVGDPLQAMPVGHAGAMACLTRRATAVVELTAVHRFRDAGYAELTLRMREPSTHDEALGVAAQLDERGSIHRVTDAEQAREVMVEAYFRWAARGRIALVTGTNEEADAINEAIQERRVEMRQLNAERLAIGQGEQRLLEGDVVQTRRNDRDANVENRALWIIRRITPSDIELSALGDSGDHRRVSLEYAAAHMHLAYASTVHGIQGETTDASVVGPGVDASGLYVGMTRGRTHNKAIAIARTPAVARDQVAASMMRGTPEVSIDDSARAARAESARAAREVVPPASPLEPQRQWLENAERALADIDQRLADSSANAHARAIAVDSPSELGDVRARLLIRYDLVTREYEAAIGSTGEAARGTRLGRRSGVRDVRVVSRADSESALGR
ncbi:MULTISPECIES: AAA family ATPase [Microbacterium]|uniref:AAA family ATPase n=1 Tax=Microbacterium TaxID=33882 RepID=UPI001F0FF188|nr:MULTISPECIES: AAA family ATPase [Microbacterium]